MTASTLIGVSTKMYFGRRTTRAWLDEASRICHGHPGVRDGVVDFFVVPGFLSLVDACRSFELVGAQDMYWEDAGSFTGEVSAVELAEVGVRLVEIGHLERRRLFGETDETIARKVAAAFRHGLRPLLCVGEEQRMGVDEAVDICHEQVRAALSCAAGAHGGLIIAYEPGWAIGAPVPASADRIRAVCDGLRGRLRDMGLTQGSHLIYGGAAGEGLLADIYPAVDGLFMGRRAHDPSVVGRVLDEAACLAWRRTRLGSGT